MKPDQMLPHPSRTRLLLTGFKPFPNNPVNATQALVPMLARAARRAFPDIVVMHEVLPTEWHIAPHRMQHLLAETQPDIALGFGISGRATRLTIETRGLNWRRSDSTDAAGVELKKGRLLVGGPRHLAAHLPVANIVGRLRRRGIPARVSRDAGGYLCNALLYHGLLQAAHIARLARIGFIHIPADLPVPATRRNGVTSTCPLTWDQVMLGSLEVIAACLGRAVGQNRHEAGRPCAPGPRITPGK
jgi:pyroglutamyl-peptidase